MAARSPSLLPAWALGPEGGSAAEFPDDPDEPDDPEELDDPEEPDLAAGVGADPDGVAADSAALALSWVNARVPKPSWSKPPLFAP